MSTNYYAYRKIPEKKRQEIIEEISDILANSATVLEIEYILSSLTDAIIPDKLEEYKECVHLGKNSGGWQFHWQLYPGQYYEPTLASIKEFLSDTEHWQIVDEYGTHFTPDEFFDEIKDKLFKGENAIDGFDYNKKHKKELMTKLSCFNEFSTEEGLRFSTDDFS